MMKWVHVRMTSSLRRKWAIFLTRVALVSLGFDWEILLCVYENVRAFSASFCYFVFPLMFKTEQGGKRINLFLPIYVFVRECWGGEYISVWTPPQT